MIFAAVINILLLLSEISYISDNQPITPPDKEISTSSVTSGDQLPGKRPSTEKKEWAHSFDINSSAIARPDVLDNLCSKIDSLLLSDTLRNLVVRGASSIDGSEPYNIRLARDRADEVRKYITAHSKLTKNDIEIVSDGENWDDLLLFVRKDKDLPMRDDVLRILTSSASNNNKENSLRTLGNGSVWKYLAENIFPPTRKTVISIEWQYAKPIVEVISDGDEKPVAPEPEIVQPAVETPPVVETVEEVVEKIPLEIEEDTKNAVDSVPPVAAPLFIPSCSGDWHLSTSLPAWAVAIVNIAGEYDFDCRWSVKLDLAYSAWNYGSHNRKFRTFVFRPEARYWFGDSHKGLFAEAHLAMLSYNVALPSWEYRIQDRKGKHPALGGGIGVGYRLPISRNGRWSAEAAIGAGVYSLDYNRYKNEPNGQLVDTKKRTFFGIDHVALSVVYNFGRNISALKHTQVSK